MRRWLQQQTLLKELLSFLITVANKQHYLDILLPTSGVCNVMAAHARQAAYISFSIDRFGPNIRACVAKSHKTTKSGQFSGPNVVGGGNQKFWKCIFNSDPLANMWQRFDWLRLVASETLWACTLVVTLTVSQKPPPAQPFVGKKLTTSGTKYVSEPFPVYKSFSICL